MIQFIPFDSDLASSLNEAYQQVMLKEVERTKYIPSQIIKMMQQEGFLKFKMHHHTQLWQFMDAKNPGKGYGVQLANTWYWYERWMDEVRKHCSANSELYGSDSKSLAA